MKFDIFQLYKAQGQCICLHKSTLAYMAHIQYHTTRHNTRPLDRKNKASMWDDWLASLMAATKDA